MAKRSGTARILLVRPVDELRLGAWQRLCAIGCRFEHNRPQPAPDDLRVSLHESGNFVRDGEDENRLPFA